MVEMWKDVNVDVEGQGVVTFIQGTKQSEACGIRTEVVNPFKTISRRNNQTVKGSHKNNRPFFLEQIPERSGSCGKCSYHKRGACCRIAKVSITAANASRVVAAGLLQ